MKKEREEGSLTRAWVGAKRWKALSELWKVAIQVDPLYI